MQPKFISIDPLGEDIFSGEAQTKVATIVAETVKAGNCKLIGLDGPWGSGKSNVIRIVEKRLAGTHQFFIYDAWSHQEELQRRAFLEALIDNVTERLLDREHWEAELTKVLAKNKRTQSTEIPTLSNAMIAFVIVLLLLPVSKAINDAVPEIGSWKILIAAAPFIVGIFSFMYFASQNSERETFREIFALYRRREIEKVTDEIISETEPSERRFKDLMQKVSDAYAAKNKKLVIVFDNMDRLPKEKVQSLWANIHTFFSDRNYSHISVIVPFDREHIGEAFGRRFDVLGILKDEGYGISFINKTFPVVFSVPPATALGWKGFFRHHFENAFGKTVINECDDVSTIYNLYYDEITPRGIIAFINEIVSIKLIWQERFPIKYLALFVSTRRTFSTRHRADILVGDYADKAHMIFKGDTEVKSVMAALFYNLEPAQAREVILFSEIGDALKNGDAPLMLKLSDDKDFGRYLNEVFIEGSVDLERFCLTMHEFAGHLTDVSKRAELEGIWGYLIRRHMSHPHGLQTNFSESDKIVLLHCKGEKLFKQLAANILKGLQDCQGMNGRFYAQALIEMQQFFKKESDTVLCSFDDVLTTHLLSTDNYLSFAAESKDRNQEFKVKTEAQVLESVLLSRFPDQMVDTYIGNYLKEFPFISLREKVQQTIEKNITARNIKVVYEVAAYFYKDLLPVPSVEKLAEIIKEFDNSDLFYPEIIVMYASQVPSEFSDKLVPDTNVFNLTLEKGRLSAKTISGAERVYPKLFRYTTKSTFLSKLKNSNAVIFKKLGELVVKGERENNESFDIALVMRDSFFICTSLGISFTELLELANRWEDMAEEQLAELRFDKYMPLSQYYGELFNSNLPVARSIIAKAMREFDEPDGVALRAAVDNLRSLEGDFVLTAVRKGAMTSLPPQFMITVEKFLISLSARSHRMWREDEQLADQILQVLTRESKVRCAEQILLGFAEEQSIELERFSYFEELIRTTGIALQMSITLCRNVLPKIKNEIQLIALLIGHVDFYLKVFDAAGDNVRPTVERFLTTLNISTAKNKLEGFDKLLVPSMQRLYGPLEIKTAKYFLRYDLSLYNHDVTAALQRIADKGGLYFWKVSGDELGLPPSPKQGYCDLEIEYSIDGATISAKEHEGGWFQAVNM